ncbi:MAG: primosomal protein N' [Planctomycetaceae bacterium]|nr:primosomal protein N' [Planctomycetaceae bacterium]
MTKSTQKNLFQTEPDRPEWEIAAEEDRLVADVALVRPLEQTYSYLVPESLREFIGPGQRVEILFGKGNRKEVAFCVGLSQLKTSNRKLKEIVGLVDREPIVSQHLLDLTRWIAERYICGWGQALETAIPAGVKKQAGTREMTFFALAADIDNLLAATKLPTKQAAIVELLREAGLPLKGDQITEAIGCSPAPIHGLRDKGIIIATRKRTATFESDLGEIAPEQDLELNADQKRVLSAINMQLRIKRSRAFVLHGVTGSGKTEVYIQAIREVVSYGRQAIVLVPEISLTPQTIRRFSSRFDSVAVLHSHLTDAERHWHWQRIARGEVQVIVGARSAIFAPAPHLGLIVIDEEHENTFKQDTAPRYHASNVARERARLLGIPLILGTATPTLETWLRVSRIEGLIPPPISDPQLSDTSASELNNNTEPVADTDAILSLPNRVSGLPMPPVSLVDIRNDPLCTKGQSIGRAMRTGIQAALADGGQVILFLNLRGFSPTVWCRGCGSGVKCHNCDITYTFHRDRNVILCHTCSAEMPPPTTCPQCGGPGIRYFGAGTQRLEQEVQAKFPNHKVIRMDSDTMQKRGSHDEALELFRHGKAHILVGTQMIAKGLDFPNVTMVGVVDADTVLHQPDLRASERTFQLIAQVAGRAGRSEKGGRVFVQTCSPTDIAIQKAIHHDYVGFAEHELKHRQEQEAPPFTHWVRVILRGPIEQAVESVAFDMSDVIRDVVQKRDLDIRVLGPAPCPITKLQSNYRFHFLLSAADLNAARILWRELRPTLPTDRSVEFVVDVDPINLR